jgi:hypothetical protein
LLPVPALHCRPVNLDGDRLKMARRMNSRSELKMLVFFRLYQGSWNSKVKEEKVIKTSETPQVVGEERRGWEFAYTVCACFRMVGVCQFWDLGWEGQVEPCQGSATRDQRFCGSHYSLYCTVPIPTINIKQVRSKKEPLTFRAKPADTVNEKLLQVDTPGP